MYCYSAIIAVFSIYLVLFCDQTSSECTQLAPCICSLPNDDYYNLTGLADAEPLVAVNYNWTVFFHPCKNVKMKIDNNITCANDTAVSLCMHDNQSKKTLIGMVEGTQMKMSANNMFPIFEIHHNDSKMIINIVCLKDRDKKTNFTLSSPPMSGSKTYDFMLVSYYGCKIESEKGLSTGSVLVIFFFICIGVYFIGGIIVLKTLRGATGWEMVPNHDFWCKLPSLVKDGVVFTFNCCRAGSYERI